MINKINIWNSLTRKKTPSRNWLVALLCICTMQLTLSRPAQAIIGGSSDTTSAGVVVKIFTSSWACSGTLVAKTWVLTAAHCLWDDSTNAYVSDLSSARIATTDGISGLTKASSNLVAAVKHPNYNGIDNLNDIGLIQVNDVFGGNIAELASPEEVKSAEDIFSSATASGFGRTSLSGSGTFTVLQVSLKLLSQDFCKSSWPYWQASFSTDYVCARGSTSATTCNGDSGGPLFVVISQKRKLAGVTSFGGVPCGSNTSVFTRVASHIAFLQTYGIGLPASTAAIVPQLPQLPPPSAVSQAPSLPGFSSNQQTPLPKFTISRVFQLVLENVSGGKCVVDIDGPTSLKGTRTRLYLSKTASQPTALRILNEFGDVYLKFAKTCAQIRSSGVFVLLENSSIKVRVIE